MQWISLFGLRTGARFSENQSAPKLENRKTSPCSPCAPNILDVLPSRMVGWNKLCNPANKRVEVFNHVLQVREIKKSQILSCMRPKQCQQISCAVIYEWQVMFWPKEILLGGEVANTFWKFNVCQIYVHGNYPKLWTGHLFFCTKVKIQTEIKFHKYRRVKKAHF